jgi:formylglycine-generating enzyme required for sulfatase activity
MAVLVDSFEPKSWGLYNVHGNVWERCAVVRHDSYKGAPTVGSAWLQGSDETRRATRGVQHTARPTAGGL